MVEPESELVTGLVMLVRLPVLADELLVLLLLLSVVVVVLPLLGVVVVAVV